jgi:DnaJ-class molecular chaperone
MGEEKLITCPTCDGLGEWDEGPLPAASPVQESPDYLQVVCDDCAGTGQLWSDRTTEELRAYWRCAQ